MEVFSNSKATKKSFYVLMPIKVLWYRARRTTLLNFGATPVSPILYSV